MLKLVKLAEHRARAASLKARDARDVQRAVLFDVFIHCRLALLQWSDARRIITATKFREFAGFLGESSSGFGIGARSRATVPGETFSRSPGKGKTAKACSPDAESIDGSKSIAHDN
jgi:hypothetical protein